MMRPRACGLVAMMVAVGCFAEAPEVDPDEGGADTSGDGTTTGGSASASSTTAPTSGETTGTTTTSTSTSAASSSTGDGASTSQGEGASMDTSSSTAAETGEPSQHTIFTTAAKFHGNEVGGLDNADGLCAATKDDGGNWRAILSSSQETAVERIKILGPVYNMQGDLVAADADALWSGVAQASVGYDETGTPIPQSDLAWVGDATNNCSDWLDTSTVAKVGFPHQGDVWLDTGMTFGCQFALHLYCISQD